MDTPMLCALVAVEGQQKIDMSEMTGSLKTVMTGTKNISQLNTKWKMGSLQTWQ